MTLEEFEKWLLNNWFEYNNNTKHYIFYIDPTDKGDCFNVYVNQDYCSISIIEKHIFPDLQIKRSCEIAIKAFHNFEKAKQFIKLLIEE